MKQPMDMQMHAKILDTVVASVPRYRIGTNKRQQAQKQQSQNDKKQDSEYFQDYEQNMQQSIPSHFLFFH